MKALLGPQGSLMLDAEPPDGLTDPTYSPQIGQLDRPETAPTSPAPDVLERFEKLDPLDKTTVRGPLFGGPDPSSGPSGVTPAENTAVGPVPEAVPVALGFTGPPTPRGLRAAQPGSPPSRPGFRAAGGPPSSPATAPSPAPVPSPEPVPALSPAPAPALSPAAPRGGGTRVGFAPPVPPLDSGAPRPLTRRCATCNALYPEDFLVCPRDATALTDETGSHPDPLVGRLIGETYQIVRVVGEGGMGRVYEARHLRLKERRFAVKALHAELAKNVEMAARFRREAESASSLHHPNVVDVFDVHQLSDGTPYFVGEFLEGEELADYIEKRGPLPPRVAVDVTRQVCSALSAAHARGIIHRDMKPENVFVLQASIESGDPRSLVVKVLDFGISKASGDEITSLTRTGVIMGTPSYMSPEQAMGKEVDLRTDVYSVGACLYTMLTGHRPFDAPDPTATLSLVLTRDPVRPRDIDPTIPEALELVVQRAMAKDPHDRYPSMAELDKALRAVDSRGGRVTSLAPSGAPIVVGSEAGGGAAARALDVASIVFGTGGVGGAVPNVSLARVARPTIVIASVTLAVWLVGGAAAALAGLVRVLHDGEVTLTESVLLVVGCLFAAATPLALYVALVRKSIWPNTVRAVQLASDLRRTTAAALVTYGALNMASRIAYTILWRSSKTLASGFWDMLLFAVSVLVALTIGGFAPLVRNLRRRRSS